MEEIRYVAVTNENRPSVIGYTNTNIINFIGRKNPNYHSYSRWYLAEGCLRTCMRQHDEYAARLFEVVKAGAEDLTARYAEDPAYYKRYDGKTRVHHITDKEQAGALLADLEAVVANVLFHANILTDGIAQVTLDMHEVDPSAWPCIAARAQKNEEKNLISDVCKLLGRCYLTEAKARQRGRPFDQKAMIRQLASISDWRNARTHNLHLFPHPVRTAGGQYVIAYSDSMNELRDSWTVRFTDAELGEALRRISNFLAWWCWKAELHFNRQTNRFWNGP